MKLIAPKLVFSKVISAIPGYFVLTVLNDGNGYPSEVYKTPILAWALEGEFLAPYPITYEGAQTDNCYILAPHGIVERAWLDSFLCEDDFLKSKQEDHMAKHGRPK